MDLLNKKKDKQEIPFLYPFIVYLYLYHLQIPLQSFSWPLNLAVSHEGTYVAFVHGFLLFCSPLPESPRQHM